MNTDIGRRRNKRTNIRERKNKERKNLKETLNNFELRKQKFERCLKVHKARRKLREESFREVDKDSINLNSSIEQQQQDPRLKTFTALDDTSILNLQKEIESLFLTLKTNTNDVPKNLIVLLEKLEKLTTKPNYVTFLNQTPNEILEFLFSTVANPPTPEVFVYLLRLLCIYSENTSRLSEYLITTDNNGPVLSLACIAIIRLINDVHIPIIGFISGLNILYNVQVDTKLFSELLYRNGFLDKLCAYFRGLHNVKNIERILINRASCQIFTNLNLLLFYADTNVIEKILIPMIIPLYKMSTFDKVISFLPIFIEKHTVLYFTYYHLFPKLSELYKKALYVNKRVDDGTTTTTSTSPIDQKSVCKVIHLLEIISITCTSPETGFVVRDLYEGGLFEILFAFLSFELNRSRKESLINEYIEQLLYALANLSAYFPVFGKNLYYFKQTKLFLLLINLFDASILPVKNEILCLYCSVINAVEYNIKLNLISQKFTENASIVLKLNNKIVVKETIYFERSLLILQNISNYLQSNMPLELKAQFFILYDVIRLYLNNTQGLNKPSEDILQLLQRVKNQRNMNQNNGTSSSQQPLPPSPQFYHREPRLTFDQNGVLQNRDLLNQEESEERMDEDN